MADVRLIPTVRAATAVDGPVLLTWRNDADTRAASISTDVVSPAAHAAWLDGALGNPRRFVLIAELVDEPVGMVRFDALDEPGNWTVSINLAPRARGRRLAAPILQAAWDWLEAKLPVVQVEATIRVTNAASIRAFERAGYRLDATDGGWHLYVREGSS
jgi:RimJ/RimL family protein N-acetyltransferase